MVLGLADRRTNAVHSDLTTGWILINGCVRVLKMIRNARLSFVFNAVGTPLGPVGDSWLRCQIDIRSGCRQRQPKKATDLFHVSP